MRHAPVMVEHVERGQSGMHRVKVPGSLPTTLRPHPQARIGQHGLIPGRTRRGAHRRLWQFEAAAAATLGARLDATVAVAPRADLLAVERSRLLELEGGVRAAEAAADRLRGVQNLTGGRADERADDARAQGSGGRVRCEAISR